MKPEDRELLKMLDALEVELSKRRGKPSQLPIGQIHKNLKADLLQCFVDNGFPQIDPRDFTPQLRREWMLEIEGGIKTTH